MFSSIFITCFIALVQSEASILGHWHWFNMGYIGIRNMVLRPCLYTTEVVRVRRDYIQGVLRISVSRRTTTQGESD